MRDCVCVCVVWHHRANWSAAQGKLSLIELNTVQASLATLASAALGNVRLCGPTPVKQL